MFFSVMIFLVFAVLFSFSQALYSNARSVQSALVADWLNYQILNRESGAQVRSSGGKRFCRLIDLEILRDSDLYGNCKVFISSNIAVDCSFRWLGRMCLRVATTAELHESELVKSEFFRVTSRICADTEKVYTINLCNNFIFSKPIYIDVYKTDDSNVKLVELLLLSAEKARME